MIRESPYPIDPDQAVSGIATDILLSVVTCGIYNLFWQARQFRVLNAFLGRQEFQFWKWALLTLITCGIYHIYTEYVMARAIVSIQRDLGKPANENLIMMTVALSVFGLTIIADAIQQHEINDFFELV